MSSEEIAIRVSNLSKRYEIYTSPRDRLKQFMLPRLQRMAGRAGHQYFSEFWALQDVSFEIKRGETVGIIGRNGSGKSTLLQMICGTLTPTSGTIQTTGRIAALLELGSGFNPEFTGRENVYMNASVLGLTREEIDARFDAIVAFADIGQFIEQPVKTYSSGMYVRLAFAVIAHVDADILVVDEALAVGDAVFTQKCMRFIRAFQGKGTLIFVSHDTASVQNLCQSGIWLKHGKIEQVGTAKSVSEAYLQYTLQEIYGADSTLTSIGPGNADADAASHLVETPVIDYAALAVVHDNLTEANGWKTGAAEIISAQLSQVTGATDAALQGNERVRLVIRARADAALARPILGFLVRDRLGQDLFGENTLNFTNRRPTSVVAGQQFEAVFEFRLPMLPNGQYSVMASVADGELYDHIQHHWLHDAMIITVSSSSVRYGLVGIPFTKAELEVTIND
jgi:lipopolysaccharide transport system ATP-binding protein